MGVQRRLIVPLAALAAAAGLAACGSDDFENEPRPPAPIELSARIGGDGVTVSPSDVGAGPVTITISNQTKEPARLVLEGPTDAASDPIEGGGVGALQVALEEGEYAVTDGRSERQTALVIGPERASSQNELLLP